ncbi:MAG: hypothetical protein HKN36_04510 [Hellea sp.]|nr:hypothetical protein [Hellea sp.]
MVKILFLGWLKEKAGGAERQVDLPDMATPEELIAFVAQGDTALADQLAEPSIRIIINKSILVDKILPDGIEEVAFMPPLSGG